jgi:hypothetical protein
VRRALGLLLLLICLPAKAHQTSDAYLSIALTNSQGTGRWAIALTDLSHVLTLDRDNDGELSDEEFEKSKPLIQKYAFDRLKFSSGAKTVESKPQGVDIQQNDSAIYLMLNFSIQLPENESDLRIDYTLFSDTDPKHRGLFRLDLPTRIQTTIFTPAQPRKDFSSIPKQPIIASPPSCAMAFRISGRAWITFFSCSRCFCQASCSVRAARGKSHQTCV